MKIINKQNLDIVKNGKGGIKSNRRSILTLLDNNKLNEKKVSFFDTSKKKNNYVNTSENKNIKYEYHDKKTDNNIEVQPTERDGINLLNHSMKKSNNNSFSIESISSISDVTHDIRNKDEHFTVNTERTFAISKSLTNLSNENVVQKITKKKNNYVRVGICKTICAKLCYWANDNLKMTKYGIKKAEDRVHYYLDVFNYIKKMQEIDLLTYCFLDHDQYKLFEYLSKPPVKFEDDNSNIYNEFLNRQVTYQSIDKKKIDLLFKSYNNIRKKDDLLFEDIKLLRLVNAEVKFLN
jgi:hypothetical protein